ncbi:MAG TPA: hypothetical protein DIU11_12640 [Pusillimonas sp.]|nr:hypothetical protein [Pusillimonas sp.]
MLRESWPAGVSVKWLFDEGFITQGTKRMAAYRSSAQALRLLWPPTTPSGVKNQAQKRRT